MEALQTSLLIETVFFYHSTSVCRFDFRQQYAKLSNGGESKAGMHFCKKILKNEYLSVCLIHIVVINLSTQYKNQLQLRSAFPKSFFQLFLQVSKPNIFFRFELL